MVPLNGDKNIGEGAPGGFFGEGVYPVWKSANLRFKGRPELNIKPATGWSKPWKLKEPKPTVP